MKQTGKTTHRWTRLTALFLALALLLAGCTFQADVPGGTEPAWTDPAVTEPAQTQPAPPQTTQQLSAEEQELANRMALVEDESVEITEADAQEINAAVARMRAAYIAGPGGEDPLVVDRNWSAYASSLGKENLSRREAEFYDRLDKVSLRYLSTSGQDGVAYKSSNGSVRYETEGVQFNDLGLSKTEAGAVYYWFRYNNPQYYFLANGYSYTSSTLYPWLFETMADGEGRAKLTNELFDKLDGWIKTVENSAVTTYQKELYANNLLCEKITYQHEYIGDLAVDQSLYSAVALESTVCAGYSMAFTAMMNAMGVDATAGLKRGTHAWNVVRFDDGNYYAVDVCWNDTDQASPAYKNDYLNVGTAGWTTQYTVECHTYTSDVASWIPAISQNNYVPTSADTNPQPVDRTAVKTPKAQAVEVGGTVIRFNLTNLDERLLVYTYADAEHKTRLEGIWTTAGVDQKDYVVAGLQPNTTYYFGFAGRKVVDEQTYNSSFVYLTVTTAADDSGVNIPYSTVPKIENIRVSEKQADSVKLTWDAVTVSESANIGYTISVYTDSTRTEIAKTYSVTENSVVLTDLTPGETYHFRIRARSFTSSRTVYAGWQYYSYQFTAPVTNHYETIEYDNGNVYYGEVENGKRNGYGKMTYSSGDVYEGEWKDDQRDGYGKYTWTDGIVYEGEYRNGQRNGYGVCTWTNGAVYAGEWVDGAMEGHGVYTYTNGDVYDGEWKDNKRHGHGIYTWANGSVHEGEWEDNQRIS